MLLVFLLFPVPLRAKLPLDDKQQHTNHHSVLLSVYIKEEDRDCYGISSYLYHYPREQLSLFITE